jgi:alpha-L-fucosidase
MIVNRLSLLFAITAGLAMSTIAPAQVRYQGTWESIDSRPTPAWFTGAKFGIFIHWGVYSVPSYAPVGNYAEWYWNALSAGPTDSKGKPNLTYEFHNRVYGKDFPYQNFAPMFHAEMYDPTHWADVFEKSGAKYVVLTSKHHDGFALWPSEEATKAWGKPWNAAVAGPKRDLIGPLADAVRDRGLKMGLYYSLYEWYNPLWLSDKQKYVSNHMFPQFKDVVTRYKPWVIFSDGEWDLPSAEWHSPELLAWLYNDSPVKDVVVVDDRWGKETRHHHGGYFTTEYGAGLENSPYAWEENRGMGFSYGYNRAETLNDYRTERELILMLVDLVSRGGNFLLDIGPTADGRIPVIMEERLIQMGKWLKVNGDAIYDTKPWKRTRQFSTGEVPKLQTGEFMIKYDITDFVDHKKPGQAVIETFFTAKGDDVYAIVPGWPGKQLVIRDALATPGMTVTLLGGGELKWSAPGNNVVVEMPDIPADSAKTSYAYAIRLHGLQAR